MDYRTRDYKRKRDAMREQLREERRRLKEEEARKIKIREMRHQVAEQKQRELEVRRLIKLKADDHTQVKTFRQAIREEKNMHVIRTLFNGTGTRPTRRDVQVALEYKNYEALFFMLRSSPETLQHTRIPQKFPIILLKLWYYPHRTLEVLKQLVEEYGFSTGYTDCDEGSVLHKCIQFPDTPNNQDWVDYLLSRPETNVNVVIVRKQAPNLTKYSDMGALPFSTPLVYAFSEGENLIASKLIQNFAKVNLKPLNRIQINEHLPDAVRALMAAGYKHKLPSMCSNITYFTDQYEGLSESQFQNFVSLERKKVRPLYILAANAVREAAISRSEIELYLKWPLRSVVHDALRLNVLKKPMIISPSGFLMPKPEQLLPQFVHPDFQPIIYEKQPRSKPKQKNL